MQGWLSSRYRLIFIVAVILITGFTATNLISYQISKNSIRTSILDNELPLSSNTIYSEIQADLLRPIFVSSLMANDTFLRDWVLDGEQSSDPMIRYLNEIKEKYEAYTSFFISANTLNYYHFSGVSRQVNPKDPADNWFFSSRDLTEPYVINIDDNKEQSGTLTVFINYRVLDYQDNFIGIAGIGLGLDAVADLISQYQENYRRSIYFVDQQGAIRLHSNDVMGTEQKLQEMDGIKTIAEQILSTSRGSFTYIKNDEVILLTTRFLPELNWYVLVELNESDATAAIRRSLQLNLIIGAGVVGLILIFISLAITGFHSRLEAMAITDKLSGLGNRQYFDLSMKQLLARLKRDNSENAMLLVDIDKFKEINDQFGHAIGDQVIQNLAKKLQSLVREADILCRWGGEEFVILTCNCPLHEAISLAEKIRITIENCQLLPEKPDLKITVSSGLTMLVPMDDQLSAFSRADKALYHAKNQGRNRIEQRLADKYEKEFEQDFV